MGARGPLPKFDRVIETSITKEMADHLDRFVRKTGCTRADVVRGLIQDSLDKANDVYEPFPTGFRDALVAKLKEVK